MKPHKYGYVMIYATFVRDWRWSARKIRRFCNLTQLNGSLNASIRRRLTSGRFDSVHFNVTKFSSRCILTRGWWFREPSFSPPSRRSPYSHLLVFQNRSDFTRFHRVSLSRPEHPFPFNCPQRWLPIAMPADRIYRTA